MLVLGFGLAVFSCFEELDNELCDPPIRAWMESQVKKIATRETEKEEVVNSTIELFLDKFLRFRERLSMCDRFFGVKSDSGSNYGGGGNFDGGRGNFGADRGGNNFGNRGGNYGNERGGFDRGRGRENGNRGQGYGGENRGGFGGDRASGRGYQGRGGSGRGGQGGGMIGRGGGFANQSNHGGGRGTAPRFEGRDHRGGHGNNVDGNNSRGGRGRGNFVQPNYNDNSYGAKRPSGDRTEDYTKRFRGGENSHDQRQSQNNGSTAMQPPEGCSWW